MIKGSTKNTDSQTFDVKVTRAKEIKEGCVAFDMIANGITIYGMFYRAGTDKNGKEYELLSFPSHKGGDDKYYNHVWFKIDDTLKTEIIAQLEKLV